MAALATSVALPRCSTHVIRFSRPLSGADMVGFAPRAEAALAAVFLVFAGKLILQRQIGRFGSGRDRMFPSRGESSASRAVVAAAPARWRMLVAGWPSDVP